FNDMNLFDVVPTLEKITLNDVRTLAAEVISEERFSVCQVIPKKK
ncbi:MAG: peptidase M16, partial [Bacillus sp. (in: firmicutes)]